MERAHVSYFRTVTYEISATCAPEAEVEWAIHGPNVEEPNVRVLHVGEVTTERPDSPDADRLKRLEREFAEVMAEPIPRQLHGRGVELAYEIAALRRAPDDIVAAGANPDVRYCPSCVDAYRNGIEPGESACDERKEDE
jgi:hypothetical protein